jgi:hypothetical protein
MRLQPVLSRLVASVLLAAPVFAAALHAQKTIPARPLIVEHVDEARLATLTGNTRPEARAAYDRGAVRESLPMPGMILILRRSAEREAAIEAYAESQQDSSSPNYHHWLTAAQQGEQFGPAQSDIDAITAWLQNNGFTVDSIAKNRMTIQFSGTAGQVQSAFHTEIHNLNVKGESHIANMRDPQIPAALAPAVVGVEALHNFFPRPLHHLGAQVRRNENGKWERISTPVKPVQSKTAAAPSGKIGDLPLFNTGGTTSGAANIEDIGPYDFATIYNLLPLWNAGTAIDGTGQTIAIVGTSDINPADVTAFRKAFGLPAYASATGSTPGLTIIHPNTPPGDCSTADNSCLNELIENSLDVEWAGAVAKNANIVLVASSSGSGSDYTSDPVYISSHYIIENNTASIMNISYGECELGLGTAGNAGYNALWQTASIAGISVFVASGDEGSASCDAGYDTSVPYGAQFGLSVSGVASTPYNTAVGGTDFNWTWITNGQSTYWNTSNASGTLESAKGYIPESPWNSTCSNSLFDVYVNQALKSNYDTATICDAFGTGQITSNGSPLYDYVDIVGGSGGKSSCTTYDGNDPSACTGGYGKPSWQTGVTGIPSDAKRDIPDVSFFSANGFSGSAYVICVSADGSCTYNATTEPTGEEVGGTSVASPIMAGVMALINQKSGSAQGLPNKVLYGLAAKQTYSNCKSESVTNSSSCVFNDIDSGTIAMPCDAGTLDCTLSTSTDSFGILSGYDAGTGFDLATGLGSLNIANAVNGYTAAVAPGVSLSATTLTFASTLVGSSTAAQTVTVTNSGTDVLTISKVGISGAGASSFAETNTCTSVIAGKTCTISVIFTPAAAGALTASLSITDNATGSPQSVALSGTGFVPSPAATLNPTTLSLSAAPGTSASGSVTLTNSGTALLTIGSIAVTGTNASVFTADSSACTATLAISASCTINITFTPAGIGSASASLTVTDNASGSPQSVALSGTGTEPTGSAYTLSAAAVSITPGSSGTSAITATGTGGYVGPSTVTLSACTLTNSPSGATDSPTCSITTAAVTFASGASTGSGGVVTIGTTAASSSARKSAALGNTAPWAGGAGVIAVAGLLLFLPGRMRRWRALLGAFLLVASIGVLSGCGGSSNTNKNPGTTAGSYTFTVTGKDSVLGTTVTTTVAVTVN